MSSEDPPQPPPSSGQQSDPSSSTPSTTTTTTTTTATSDSSSQRQRQSRRRLDPSRFGGGFGSGSGSDVASGRRARGRGRGRGRRGMGLGLGLGLGIGGSGTSLNSGGGSFDATSFTDISGSSFFASGSGSGSGSGTGRRGPGRRGLQLGIGDRRRGGGRRGRRGRGRGRRGQGRHERGKGDRRTRHRPAPLDVTGLKREEGSLSASSLSAGSPAVAGTSVFAANLSDLEIPPHVDQKLAGTIKPKAEKKPDEEDLKRVQTEKELFESVPFPPIRITPDPDSKGSLLKVDEGMPDELKDEQMDTDESEVLTDSQPAARLRSISALPTVDSLGENEIFLVQLPPSLPLSQLFESKHRATPGVKQENGEQPKPEDEIEEEGEFKKPMARRRKRVVMRKPKKTDIDFFDREFTNPLVNCKSGTIGEVLAYEDRAVLVIGDVQFELRESPDIDHCEDLFLIDPAEKTCCNLGAIQKRLVAVPCIDDWLEQEHQHV